ncbi:uncharacterized protein LOC142923452 [Petromyzon marinus]|uniref:uncharacterized protein LOC142923452 n=1 Tax=Petromyzon marinus TaxID=7757 RepID=UPI003F6ECC5F
MTTHTKLENLTRQHAIVAFPPSEVSVEAVATAVAGHVGCSAVLAAQRENRGVTVYVAEEGMVARLVEAGLTVGDGLFLTCSPLATPAVRVVISGAPPFLPTADIQRDLLRFGTMVSRITMLPLRTTNPRMAHVMTLQRHAFMILKGGDTELNVTLKYNIKGHINTVYASSALPRCFGCGGVGHTRRNCKNKKSGSDAPAEPSTPAREERRQQEKLEQQQQPQRQKQQQQEGQQQQLQQQQEGQQQPQKQQEGLQQKQQQQSTRGEPQEPAPSCGAPAPGDGAAGFTLVRRKKRKAKEGSAVGDRAGAPSKRTAGAGRAASKETVDAEAVPQEEEMDLDGGCLDSSDEDESAEQAKDPAEGGDRPPVAEAPDAAAAPQVGPPAPPPPPCDVASAMTMAVTAAAAPVEESRPGPSGVSAPGGSAEAVVAEASAACGDGDDDDDKLEEEEFDGIDGRECASEWSYVSVPEEREIPPGEILRYLRINYRRKKKPLETFPDYMALLQGTQKIVRKPAEFGCTEQERYRLKALVTMLRAHSRVRPRKKPDINLP